MVGMEFVLSWLWSSAESINVPSDVCFEELEEMEVPNLAWKILQQITLQD